MSRAPQYLPRRHSMIADFVVYHRDHGPDASVWLVPGTEIEEPGAPYRSKNLANAEPFSYARMHQREMEARMAKARERSVQSSQQRK
jgi:hypothetical protein